MSPLHPLSEQFGGRVLDSSVALPADEACLLELGQLAGDIGHVQAQLLGQIALGGSLVAGEVFGVIAAGNPAAEKVYIFEPTIANSVPTPEVSP